MTKWKLAPVEPTPEMLDAGHRAAWQSVPSLFDRDDVANVYRAMLAAAPAARLEDQPPPADVAMLASANRELSTRMAKVIAALHKAPVPFAEAIDNDKYLVSNVETIENGAPLNHRSTCSSSNIPGIRSCKN